MNYSPENDLLNRLHNYQIESQYSFIHYLLFTILFVILFIILTSYFFPNSISREWTNSFVYLVYPSAKPNIPSGPSLPPTPLPPQELTLDKAVDEYVEQASNNNEMTQQIDYEPPKQITNQIGWCYIGEDRENRSCIQVGNNDYCMSGDVFPTKDICINPSLRL